MVKQNNYIYGILIIENVTVDKLYKLHPLYLIDLVLAKLTGKYYVVYAPRDILTGIKKFLVVFQTPT